FLGFGPEMEYTCTDGVVDGGEGHDDLRDRPLEFLRAVIRDNEVLRPELPFVGGLVGYFSYEFASEVEPSFPRTRSSDFPEFELGLYQEGIVYDHSSFRAYYFDNGTRGRLFELLSSLPSPRPLSLRLDRLEPDSTRESYESSVTAARERIHAGEAFQIVLSRSASSAFSGSPLAFYERLRRINPSPYMFCLDFGERHVVGSSPETLLTVRGSEAITFPIAGTRPSGCSVAEGRKLREEMLNDEKERAEHCMLVDLARNDLGKVSKYGSVHLPQFMQVETFSRVQHIVSRVQGTLRPGKDMFDALKAVFPAGTVSGAPKPRAMEVIAELEGAARGPYAGGVGYLSFNGNLDTAITIRSAFASGGRIRLQAGAGIVADSDPAREYLETEGKMAALVDALGLMTREGDEEVQT
ncbi:MAG: anthranilate synthase component I family protein, partial [Methanomassiliicoccales archaeon]|nr:anthranilate synthase component I family protein [Methanomassiliicoccales archaeon]